MGEASYIEKEEKDFYLQLGLFDSIHAYCLQSVIYEQRNYPS